jgi:heptosyltransferase II
VRRTITAEKIERVVVRGASWVGDAVMTIPALRQLRRILPNAHITLATRSWAEGIFKDADYIDEILSYSPERSIKNFMQQVSEWRKSRFDLAILLQNAFEPAFISFAARVPFRIGYATDGRRRLLNYPVAVPSWRSQKHEVYYYLNIISELERTIFGISYVEDHPPDCNLVISETRKNVIRKFLNENGTKPDRPVIVLCPGSTNSRAKRWPSERFAMLADMLLDRLDSNVILIGAAEELDVTNEVISQMRNRPVVLTGKMKLDETVALLSLADLLITNDTGPAHIGAALNCPTLVIFGPTNPVTTSPFSKVAEVIRKPPECAPCMLRDCPIDHRCMTAITPEEIFNRASTLVKSKYKD